MNKRISDLDKLKPQVKEMTERLLKLCKKEGLNVYVFETYRTHERSNYLHKKGTGARAGYSFHNYGRAVDIVFKDSAGNWTWSNSCNWERLAQLGESVGFEAGRRWKKLVDSPHFQLAEGNTIIDLINYDQMNDKYTKWAKDSELCNNEKWDKSMTKYEIIVFANRLVKYIINSIKSSK